MKNYNYIISKYLLNKFSAIILMYFVFINSYSNLSITYIKNSPIPTKKILVQNKNPENIIYKPIQDSFSIDDTNHYLKIPLKVKTDSIINESCVGAKDGKIYITASGGIAPYQYYWSNSKITEDLVNIKSGTYTVTIADKQKTYLSIEFKIIAKDSIDINYSVNNVLCKGEDQGMIELKIEKGTEPYNYKWTNTIGIENLALNLKAGNYTVTVSDAKNCMQSISFTITEPKEKLIVEVEKKNPQCAENNNGEIKLNTQGGIESYLYQWNLNSTYNEINKLSSGIYKYTVSDQIGCVVTGEVELKNNSDECIIFPSAFSPNDDGINDRWVIDKLEDLYPGVTVEVFNRFGEIVFSSKGYEQAWDGTYNGKQLPVDTYHYIIHLNNGTKPKTGQITILK